MNSDGHSSKGVPVLLLPVRWELPDPYRTAGMLFLTQSSNIGCLLYAKCYFRYGDIGDQDI